MSLVSSATIRTSQTSKSVSTIKTSHTNVHGYLGKGSGKSDCNQNRNVWTYFIKNPKNEIVGLHADRRTDGQYEAGSH
jgi:hypothetical protein